MNGKRPPPQERRKKSWNASAHLSAGMIDIICSGGNTPPHPSCVKSRRRVSLESKKNSSPSPPPPDGSDSRCVTMRGAGSTFTLTGISGRFPQPWQAAVWRRVTAPGPSYGKGARLGAGEPGGLAYIPSLELIRSARTEPHRALSSRESGFPGLSFSHLSISSIKRWMSSLKSDLSRI